MKTYNLKILYSIIYKGIFCYFFSTPKHILQAQMKKIIEQAKTFWLFV